MKTKEITVLADGIPVTVRVNEKGRPLSASAGDGPNGESRAALIALVWARLTQEAQSSEHKRGQKISEEIRHAKATAHWSGEWLAAAHKNDESLGAERLALAARRLHTINKSEIKEEKRAEINEYRAKQFLRHLRKK